MEKSDKSVVVVSSAEELRKLLPRSADAKKTDEEEAMSSSEHTIELGGEPLDYIAKAGTIRIELPEKPPVELFVVSYVKKGAGVDRPVTFCFNGGPGSSSIWLHMGFLGPKRVIGDVDDLPKMPGRAVDNVHTLLSTSDLVFIDPTSTGFSRPVEGKGKEFHGLTADIESVGELIRRWIAENGRWASPKYIAGESYGTTRAVGIAHHLQEKAGMDFNGLVLISLALRFETILYTDSNWLPNVMMLASAAVVARYHGRVEHPDLLAFHDKVEAWAYRVYLPALAQGDRLPEAEQQAVAETLADYLGLTADFVRRCNLRVHLGRFTRELLRDERWMVGRLDGRFKARAKDAAGEQLEYHASLGPLMGAYNAALQQQLYDIGCREAAKRYEVLNRDVWPWTFDGFENAFVDVGERLRDTLNQNPNLRVFVASGLYDLATTWTAAEYTLSQLGLEPERRAAITSRRYAAGHMMYIHEPTAVALRADLEAFYSL